MDTKWNFDKFQPRIEIQDLGDGNPNPTFIIMFMDYLVLPSAVLDDHSLVEWGTIYVMEQQISGTQKYNYDNSSFSFMKSVDMVLKFFNHTLITYNPSIVLTK